MRINYNDYPYPVLFSDIDNNNYGNIKGRFVVNYELLEDSREIVIEVDLENEIIESMLNDGSAALILHVEAPETSYRKIFKFDNNELVYKIDVNEITGNVELNTLITTHKYIEKYWNKYTDTLPDDYIVYGLEIGSPLAVSETYRILIESSDEIPRNIPSIISVGKTNLKHMEVNLDADVIVVQLPNKEYEQYVMLSQVSSDMSQLIMTSTIFPALSFALSHMGNDKMSGGSVDLEWYQVLNDKLADMNIEVRDIDERYSSIEIAQRILEDPLGRSFDSAERMLNNE